jgi:hypothetical protein
MYRERDRLALCGFAKLIVFIDEIMGGGEDEGLGNKKARSLLDRLFIWIVFGLNPSDVVVGRLDELLSTYFDLSIFFPKLSLFFNWGRLWRPSFEAIPH